jgi:hypothetical protein
MIPNSKLNLSIHLFIFYVVLTVGPPLFPL